MLPGGKVSGTVISEYGPSWSRPCETITVGISSSFAGRPLRRLGSKGVSYEDMLILAPRMNLALVRWTFQGSTEGKEKQVRIPSSRGRKRPYCVHDPSVLSKRPCVQRENILFGLSGGHDAK